MTASLPRLPAEWEPHRALWVGWPRLPEEWEGRIDAVREEIAAFVRAAAPFVDIRLAVGDDGAEVSARDHRLHHHADICRIPTGDIWLRDTGPILALDAQGEPVAHLFAFNGWGEKFTMPGDQETAQAMAAYEAIPVRKHDMVLEGGALESNGHGTLLTTRSCLLNPNRNGIMTEARIEDWLSRLLYTDRVIWLDQGLHNDHTDGHIDNLARFVSSNHIICQHTADSSHPHKEILEHIINSLKKGGFRVTTIPAPPVQYDDEEAALPASHLNYTLTNGVVLVPVFCDQQADEIRDSLIPLFTDRQVITLPATNILSGGGGFHCMTKDIPTGGKA